jgi:hypothetical protein
MIELVGFVAALARTGKGMTKITNYNKLSKELRWKKLRRSVIFQSETKQRPERTPSLLSPPPLKRTAAKLS